MTKLLDNRQDRQLAPHINTSLDSSSQLITKLTALHTQT